MLELPSVGKRLGACCCASKLRSPTRLAPRMAVPGPAQAPRRVRQSPAKSPPKPRQSPARRGGPGLAFGIGITAGRSPCGGPVARKNRGRLAPLGGEVRARLIHPSPGRLYGAAFGGDRPIQPSGCRMERSQFSAHLRRAAAIRRRSITTVPRPDTHGSSPPSRSVTFACSACDEPSATWGRSSCCDDPFRSLCWDDPMVTQLAWVDEPLGTPTCDEPSVTAA